MCNGPNRGFDVAKATTIRICSCRRTQAAICITKVTLVSAGCLISFPVVRLPLNCILLGQASVRLQIQEDTPSQ
jgi:hypothetical protein